MEKIIKCSDAAANAIIDPYLSWARSMWWYGEDCGRVLYEKLRLRDATGYNNRHKLIDEILLPEQDFHCCYCMRSIVDHTDDASIEHIIPQHTSTQDQMDVYFSHGGLNNNNVCLTPNYVRRNSVGAPYPHHVAYHNFAVACQKCNSSRGHNEIEPIFLFDNIENEVTYNQQTGEVEWIFDPAYVSVTPTLPTLEKLDLNRPLLKAIRAVWFYAKSQGLDPHIANREDLIYGAIGESLTIQPTMRDDEFNAFLSLNVEEIWKILLKYQYFG